MESPTLTTWFSLFFSSLKSVILIPLVLRTYSSQDTEFWLITLSISAFSNHLDLGFFSTISRTVSYTIERVNINDPKNGKVLDENGKIAQLTQLYFVSIVIFTIISIIIVTTLLSYGSFNYFNNPNFFPEPRYFQFFTFFTLSTALIQFGKIFKTFLHGHNKIIVMNYWNSFWNILIMLCSFYAINRNYSILHIIFINQFFQILGVLRDYLLFKSEVIVEKFDYKNSNSTYKNIFSYIWRPTWRTGMGILGSSGVTEFTGLILASYGHPAVASYLLSLRLLTFISAISKAPFYSKLPVFAALRAKKNIKELALVTKRSLIISLSVFVSCVLMVLMFSEYILIFIDSNTSFVSKRFWNFMSLIWLLERNHAMHAQIYSTTNHIPFHKPIVLSGIINLTILYFLLDSCGIWAVLIGHGISNLLINNWYNVRLSLNSINQNIIIYLSQTLLPFLVILILSLFIIW